MTIPFELALPLLPQDEIRREYLFELYSFVSSLPKPALILEIGCWLGQSALIMACAAQGTDSHIISVDPVFITGYYTCIKEADEIFTYKSSLIVLLHRIAALHLDGYISIVPDSSGELLARWDTRKLDFLLIDGEHSADAVSQDCLWLEHVKPCGYVAYDDWHLEPVKEAAKKYLEQHPEWELFKEHRTTSFFRRR